MCTALVKTIALYRVSLSFNSTCTFQHSKNACYIPRGFCTSVHSLFEGAKICAVDPQFLDAFIVSVTFSGYYVRWKAISHVQQAFLQQMLTVHKQVRLISLTVLPMFAYM